MITSKRVRWKGTVERMVEKRNECKVLVGKERDYQKDLDADGRIICKWILGKLDGRHELD
jgi:hypothetical protein